MLQPSSAFVSLRLPLQFGRIELQALAACLLKMLLNHLQEDQTSKLCHSCQSSVSGRYLLIDKNDVLALFLLPARIDLSIGRSSHERATTIGWQRSLDTSPTGGRGAEGVGELSTAPSSRRAGLIAWASEYG